VTPTRPLTGSKLT